MSDKAPLKRIRRMIVINLTSSGGNDLQNCYFLRSEVDGFYNFFNEAGETLATGVSDGVPFPFLLDGIAWTITELKIHHHLKRDRIEAKGHWRNNVIETQADGTFQAESGGGADDEVDKAVTSCTHPANEIEIKKVSGDPDKDKLKHCFFLPTSVADEFDFYDNDCNLLKSGLKTKTDFDFNHDSIKWIVTEFTINDSKASGKWKTQNHSGKEQTGSFQAESGGGIGEGKGAASAASA